VRAIVPCLVLLAASLCAGELSPAIAEKTLGLAEVLEAVKDEPDLVRQIDVELRRRDLKPVAILCSAAVHGEEWRLLGGSRAAPYQCTIGDRALRIDAERTYFDAQGHRLGQLGKAPDSLLFQRAKYFREGKFRWSWDP
jgi:hypothetical protein